MDGNALLSAVRSELEKWRCSAWGQIFTASVPAAAGREQDPARARAVWALARYSWGLPWHRLEGCPARGGVPVPEATPGEQGESGGDGTPPVCTYVEQLAAQGEGICQEEPRGRVLALIAENQQAAVQARAQGKAQGDERTGRQPTAVRVQVGGRRLGLSYPGRRPAGENLDARLTKREPGRGQPLVLSAAWRSTQAEEASLIRGHCLAQGRRKFTEWAADFPAESALGVNALKLGDDQEDEAREKQRRAEERLGYHQPYSAPVFTTLKPWLEQQTTERWGEPKRRLGQAIADLLDHGDTLTQVVKEPGAPRDPKVAERAVKLGIRQRKSAWFYATEQSAYLASVLTSVRATGVQAGGNALDSRVAVQEHRQEVCTTPRAWRPGHDPAALVPA